MPSHPLLAWHAWSTEAFALAQSGRRPLLLVVTVPWSAACERFAADLASQPELWHWLARAFVPVLVDAERRPDISERYAVGGWPSVVALNPVGTPLSTLPSDVGALRPAAERVLDALATRFDALAVATLDPPRVSQLAPSGHDVAAGSGNGLTGAVVSEAAALALHAADFDHGGFGGAVKFPLDVPLRVCLADLVRRPHDLRLLAFVERTLDAMSTSELWDGVEGGVYRAATRADWTLVDPVKLLESNVALIETYLEASHLLGRPADVVVARSIGRFVRARLAHPRGGFLNATWSTPEGPRLDDTLRADTNARAVRAFLHLAAALDDVAWESEAIVAMEHLVPALYERGAGVAHVLGERAEVRGLVADQVAVAAAAIDLYFVTEGTVYGDLAEELMRGVWRKYWLRDWGLIDRIGSTAGAGVMGLLGHPLPAFRAGCEAAEVLEKLARLTGSDEYAVWAGELWRWLESRFRLEGLDAGALALARLGSV